MAACRPAAELLMLPARPLGSSPTSHSVAAVEGSSSGDGGQRGGQGGARGGEATGSGSAAAAEQKQEKKRHKQLLWLQKAQTGQVEQQLARYAERRGELLKEQVGACAWVLCPSQQPEGQPEAYKPRLQLLQGPPGEC